MNQGLSHFSSSALLLAILLLSASCTQKKPSVSTPKSNEAPIVLSGAEIVAAKKIRDMSFEEGVKVLSYYKAQGKDSAVAMVLERLVGLAADHESMEPILRQLADLKFKLEDFGEAEIVYQQYALFYPGSKDSDYIESRIIESMQKQLLDGQRDQSKVKSLLQYAHNFKERFGDKNKYAPMVLAILNEAQKTLFESELNRVVFYLQKYAYTEHKTSLKSAYNRLIDILNKPEIDVILPADKDKKILVEKAIESIKAERFLTEPLEIQFSDLQRVVDRLLLSIEESRPLSNENTLTRAFKSIF